LKLRNCSIDELIKRIEGEVFICFGAGAFFVDMLKFYAEYGIKNKIAFLIDNNPNLWDTEIMVENNFYKVYSVDELKKYSSRKINILITTAYFNEIINQLEESYKSENIDVYVFPIIQEFDKGEYNSLYKKSKIKHIPKIIHYCWFGGNKLPNSAKYCIDSWRKYCPDYEIIEWNEKNYDVKKIQYAKEAYDVKEYAFVSDYVRLDVVNRYGGIYMDTDVEVIKNLDNLLYNEAYCGFLHHSPRINTGAGFGARKGFHILEEWMESYKKEKFILDNGELNKRICTYYQTDVLKTKDFKENGKFQVVEGLVCYPKEFFEPLSYLTGLNKKTDNTYSIHHGTLFWNSSLKDVRTKVKTDMSSILKRMEEAENGEKYSRE